MWFTRFRSRDPLNHVQRVLDILQRMGFALRSVSVRPDTDGRSTVRLHYSTAGALSADTFVARVTGLRDIEDLRHGKAGQGLGLGEKTPCSHSDVLSRAAR